MEEVRDNTNILTEELLVEKTKTQMLDQSRNGANYAPGNQYMGKNRYERSRHSQLSSNTKPYTDIDFNRFFKKDELAIILDVRGETSNYNVKIMIKGILKELQSIMKRNKDAELEDKFIQQALLTTFDHKDVYIWCSCPDFKYRFNYLADKDDYNSEHNRSGIRWSDGDNSSLPWDEPPLETNPLNDKGAGCKHIIRILENKHWPITLVKVIRNYINLVKDKQERLYQTFIYPQVYGKKFDAVQQQLIDLETGKKSRDYLHTGRSTIKQATDYAKERNQFKPGNKEGIRFAKSDDGDDQLQLDMDFENEPTDEQDKKELDISKDFDYTDEEEDAAK